MIRANQLEARQLEPRINTRVNSCVKVRRSVQNSDPSVLADIYQEEINIAVWQRQLCAVDQESVQKFLLSNPSFQTVMTVTPHSAHASIGSALGSSEHTMLSNDIAELVAMFCCLFGLKRAGLRLTVLNRAMCPRFHVDRIPCRLVTTYQGDATQWLPHQSNESNVSGAEKSVMPGYQTELSKSASNVQQLQSGDVALLKGELWEGNEGAGLVHRSPGLSKNQYRLLLTLDFSN